MVDYTIIYLCIPGGYESMLCFYQIENMGRGGRLRSNDRVYNIATQTFFENLNLDLNS